MTSRKLYAITLDAIEKLKDLGGGRIQIDTTDFNLDVTVEGDSINANQDGKSLIATKSATQDDNTFS